MKFIIYIIACGTVGGFIGAAYGLTWEFFVCAIAFFTTIYIARDQEITRG